jgi:hypothetical protein
MRTPFVDLRLTGELLYGGAHDTSLGNATVHVAIRRPVLPSGRRARSLAEGRRVTFLGRTLANAYGNYSSLSKSDVYLLASAETSQPSHSPPPGHRTPYVAVSFELFN